MLISIIFMSVLLGSRCVCIFTAQSINFSVTYNGYIKLLDSTGFYTAPHSKGYCKGKMGTRKVQGQKRA